MTFLEELNWRGLIKDVTDLEGLKERLKSPITCYCGFDPTADSLHVGHLQQVLLLKRYQVAGHTPIILVGGATGMIGDPRMTSERNLLTLEDVRYNAECIKKQLAHFLSFEGENAAIMVNNYDWISKLNVIDYLRDYGKCFNLSYMLAKDAVASRLETGISYTEFSYMLLQSIDFLHLYLNYNCELQIGGSDQWGNLTSGCELVKKIEDGSKVYGVTSPLITKSDGSKFGKSEGQNVWLDPEKTSAYEFYQFFFNIADNDVVNMLKRLSMKSVKEIENLAIKVKNEPHLREAQKALAEELTELVHGKEGLQSALNITEALFSGNIKDLTNKEIKDAFKDANTIDIEENVLLIDALVNSKAASSKREAREFINNGSISINGEKCTSLEKILTKDDSLDGETIVIKKGKKSYFIFKV
ncbi:MAG TPA: tyrosine--tRNA ligase [Erysipelotrichaceae bacterium]|nr:tyrosine--tRNA ligase [Erysipelotrichia bacterium]HPX33258.1 tyrosine--tRNA ligase [Erysipelotrichaceae bacterium]HQA85667.1 tyrosine--tRNA ligase [Erysipelotrichaceae bacterium]